MSKRRASTLFLRNSKRTHYDVFLRKRHRDHILLEKPAKRVCYDPDTSPDIELTINEVEPTSRKKIEIHLRPEFWMAAAFSVDPREYAATDIQRVFKGWSFRRRRRLENELTNSFVTFSLQEKN